MFVIYMRAKFRMSVSSCSLVAAVRLKAKVFLTFSTNRFNKSYVF
jgi:hypothetical protein